MASVDKLMGESDGAEAGKCGEDNWRGAGGSGVCVGDRVEVGRLTAGRGNVEVVPAATLPPTVVIVLCRASEAEKLW